MDHLTEFRYATGNVFTLDLTFRQMPKTSDAVLELIKAEIPNFVSKCDGDILASGWFCPDEETETLIPLPDGSMHLIYRRSDGAILTWAEYSGQTKDVKETDRFLAVVSSEATYKGIEPPKTWFTVSVLFKSKTCALDIYEILVHVCRDWAVCGMPVHTYAFYGERDNRLTWEQIRDSDSAFMTADFDPATGNISRKGRFLGKA